jgi:N-acetylgalactosamine-6-sulfatase
VTTPRRAFLKAMTAAPLVTRSAPAATPPDIVIFLGDDLGSADLSSYGATDIRTPNIDSIGRRGARLTRFYANAPECTPTRTALLTGRYQHRVGGLECAIGIGDVGRYDEAEWLQKRGELGLPASEISLAQILKSNGYDTAIFGKWHLGYPARFWPNHHGFDASFGILGGNADYFTHKEESEIAALYANGRNTERKGYLTDLIAQAAIAWLKQRSSRPFFLYVPFTCPHTPIQDPDEFNEKTGTAPVRNRDRKVYAKMVERMDARIGDVLRALPRENTIVLFSSDNGADPNGNNGPLRGGKGTLWEGGIRSPLLIHWPGNITGGTTLSQVGLTMDLAPTLLAAAGIAPPRPFDGVDLLPVLRGRRQVFSRTVFWRYKRLENRRGAVRVGDLKYVRDNGEESLHDLATDEFEQNNLAASRPRDIEQMRARFAAWEKEVAAPRLRDFRPGK